MSGQVSGPGSPNLNKPTDQLARTQEAQKVGKVDEIDPDARARQRFQQMMEEPEEEGDEAPLPSPFESAFYASNNRDTSDLDGQKIPDPSYSSPPNLSSDADQPLKGDQLPRSKEFWGGVDISDQPMKKAKVSPHAKEDTSLFGMAGKPPAKKEKTSLFDTSAGKQEPSPFDVAAHKKGKTAKPERDETAMPTAQYWSPKGDQTPTHRPGAASTKDASIGKKGAETNPVFEEPSEPKEFSTAFDMDSERLRDEGEKKNKKSSKIVDFVMPSLPELPLSIQPAAMAATNAAASYLHPSISPIFFQMVGSMMVMSSSPKGNIMSKTEITLNNPAFANSRFFGAKIEITQYKSAPDSYNIKLSGTNEAVTAFSQNVGALESAFNEGNFNFRVGRIDVEYATDRPVLHRRDAEEGGSDNDQESR